MDSNEQTELRTECGNVISRVNAIIAGLEENKRRNQQPDIDQVLNALVDVNNAVIDLGAHFNVSV